MNSLKDITVSITTGKYIGLVSPDGKVWAGRVTGIMMEDGSGKNWIVNIKNSDGTQRVFVKAS